MNLRLRRLPRTFLIAGLFTAGSIIAQSPPEPPLPTPASREARAAAAAVQTPSNVRPPPPLPTQVPVPAGAVATPPPAASPIPPQVPESATPPPSRSPGAAAPQAQLPTGFTSKVTSSTSGSGQFKIYGKDLQTRSPFSSRCDEIADRLKRLLRDDEPWVLPVVVSIKMPPDIKLSGPAVSTTISQITNGGFHLQVTVQVRPDLRPADIDAELTRILIAERILRNKNAITTKRPMVLPEWLLTGVTQALSFRDRSRPSAVFAAIFKSGKIYGIEEILDAAPGQLDALSRTIYETSCCALVLALLDQTEGPKSLRQFLSLLAVDSRDDRALLNHCFPRLALSGSSLNKWWSLQMASLATPSVFETLGPTATRKALTEALVIHYETTVDSAPKKTTVIADADEPPSEPPAEEKKHGLFGKLFGAGASGEAAAKSGEDKADAAKAKPDEPAKTKTAAADKPADETVQEEKKRGILGRMFGGSTSAPEEPAVEATDEKKQKPDTEADAPPEPKKTGKATEKPAAADDEGKAEEPKKPGFLGRMFGGSGGAPEEPAVETKDEKKQKPDSKADAPPEPKKTGKATESPAAADDEGKVEEPKKPGLLGRMLGGSSADEPTEKPKEDKKPETATKPEAKKPKPEPEPKEKPAKKSESTKPAADESSAEPKKRGFLGRMFGSGGASKPEEESEPKPDKKSTPDKEKPEAKTEEKKKSASADALADPMLTLRDQWIALAEPWLAKAGALWTDYAGAGSHAVKLRLSFGKKKTDEPEKPAEASKKKPEKAEPEPEKKPAPSPKAKSEPTKPRMVPVSIPLDDYANIMKRKDRAVILNGTSRALAALLPRAHVLFRPIIDDYIALVSDLQSGKSKDADQRLAALRTRTAKAYDQAKAVEDHLDWYEASETKNYSGAFEDYLKLPAQIEKELPVRDDPLSRYLDALDLEFGK